MRVRRGRRLVEGLYGWIILSREILMAAAVVVEVEVEVETAAAAVEG
jgi:hypothetical protein